MLNVVMALQKEAPSITDTFTENMYCGRQLSFIVLSGCFVSIALLKQYTRIGLILGLFICELDFFRFLRFTLYTKFLAFHCY